MRLTVPGEPVADETYAPTLQDRSDIDKANAIMQVLAPGTHLMRYLVVEGPPKSKARPRVGKRGHFYSPAKPHEDALGWHLKGLMKGEKFEGNVAIGCIFYRPNRQRVDVDNLLKLVMDAATGIAWDDDSQVTAQLGVIEYDPERPRTVIILSPHTSSLTRGEAARVACEACGRLFFPAGKRREVARWCSRECRAVLTEPVPCPQCGEPFKRRTGNQKFCSQRCSYAARSARARAARDQRTHCGRGHVLDDANTHVLVDGRRRCRRCQADAAKRTRKNRHEREEEAS